MRAEVGPGRRVAENPAKPREGTVNTVPWMQPWLLQALLAISLLCHLGQHPRVKFLFLHVVQRKAESV